MLRTEELCIHPLPFGQIDGGSRKQNVSYQANDEVGIEAVSAWLELYVIRRCHQSLLCVQLEERHPQQANHW